MSKFIFILFQYGNTPLKLAAEKNHYETVELLISKGANVNQADNVIIYEYTKLIKLNVFFNC